MAVVRPGPLPPAACPPPTAWTNPCSPLATPFSHAWQEGRWVLYNDEKVAVSEHPPVELGYLYVYRRVPGSGGATGDEAMQA